MLDEQTESIETPLDDENGREKFDNIGDLWDAKVKEIAGTENAGMIQAFEEFARSRIMDPNKPRLEEISAIGDQLIACFNEATKGYGKSGVIDSDIVKATLKKYENQPLLAAALKNSLAFLEKVNTINGQTEGEYFENFSPIQKKSYIPGAIMSVLHQYKPISDDGQQGIPKQNLQKPPQIDPSTLGGLQSRSSWRVK